jgi:hydroxypyruvate reductase
MNSLTELRTAALQIFHRTLAAIEVESVVRSALRVDGEKLVIGATQCDLTRLSRIIVIGIGKASAAMARAVDSVLGERISGGLVVTNALTGAAPLRLPILIGGHPVPNEQSAAAAEAALKLLRENDSPETLVIFLISGGGSALFEKPADDRITLSDLQAVNRVLVGCGAVIGEMNVVRRFLSAVKGGRLADAAPHAQQLSLYISDVNRDDLATVASGPTIANTVTRADFDRIVARYDLLSKFPENVTALIKRGEIPDSKLSPAQTQPQADGASVKALRAHHLLLDNQRALSVAQGIAENDFGCVVEVADDLVEGEVAEMVLAHLERLAALSKKHSARTVCLLSGGEVICPVRGNGSGGRNQEFVLRAAMNMSGREAVVLSAGTDGIDGNSPAAGAIADGTTVSQALRLKMLPNLYCLNSDSFNFFNALNDAIITGPTGNNVRDLRILLAQ